MAKFTSYYNLHKELLNTTNSSEVFDILYKYNSDVYNGRVTSPEDDEALQADILSRLCYHRGINWRTLLLYLDDRDKSDAVSETTTYEVEGATYVDKSGKTTR